MCLYDLLPGNFLFNLDVNLLKKQLIKSKLLLLYMSYSNLSTLQHDTLSQRTFPLFHHPIQVVMYYYYNFEFYQKQKNPQQNSSYSKDFFYNLMIFNQGEELRIRVKKICEGFHANVYSCPDKAMDRENLIQSMVTRNH